MQYTHSPLFITYLINKKRFVTKMKWNKIKKNIWNRKQFIIFYTKYTPKKENKKEQPTYLLMYFDFLWCIQIR